MSVIQTCVVTGIWVYEYFLFRLVAERFCLTLNRISNYSSKANKSFELASHCIPRLCSNLSCLLFMRLGGLPPNCTMFERKGAMLKKEMKIRLEGASSGVFLFPWCCGTDPKGCVRSGLIRTKKPQKGRQECSFNIKIKIFCGQVFK